MQFNTFNASQKKNSIELIRSIDQVKLINASRDSYLSNDAYRYANLINYMEKIEEEQHDENRTNNSPL